VTPRDPQFKQKAARVCDLYTGMWEDEHLGEGDVNICADEKTGIQARSRRKIRRAPVSQFVLVTNMISTELRLTKLH